MHFILIRPLFSRGCRDHMVVCNQCLSPLTLRVWIPLGPCVLDTTLCDEVCQWLAAGFLRILQFPSPTDRNDISEILLKVAFKYHHPNPFFLYQIPVLCDHVSMFDSWLFYWWRKPEKTTDRPQVANNLLSHNVVLSTPRHEQDSSSQRLWC